MTTARVMLFRVGQIPDVMRMPPSWASARVLIDCELIQPLPLGDQLFIYSDEEAMLRRKEPNRPMPKEMKLASVGWVIGDFLVVRQSHDGQMLDMTDKDVSRVMKIFGEKKHSGMSGASIR